MRDERDQGVSLGHEQGEQKAEPHSTSTTTKDGSDQGMDRRRFMNYAGLGALAGLSLVALGACNSGGGSGGEADEAQDGTGTAPRVLSTTTVVDGISPAVVVKFSTRVNSHKTCYQFIWNPIPVGDYEGTTFTNSSGRTSLTSKYTAAVAYAGTVTVKINTADIGCADNKLLCDLYGANVTPYTKTVTFA